MKTLIKRLARLLGFEIRRYTPAASDIARVQQMLSYNQIDLILDVGANTGQFARSVRSGGYEGRIVSFEPLSSAYADLARHSQKDPKWIVATRVAIGKEEGETDINISEYSGSSSIMPMSTTLLEVKPETRYIGTEKVRVSRLDSIAAEYVDDSKSTYLKIDTQGFEDQVIEGASGILPKVELIQVELSLVQLYEGQLLFVEMINKLADLGYELQGLLPVFTEPNTGKLLQVDGIFGKLS